MRKLAFMKAHGPFLPFLIILFLVVQTLPAAGRGPITTPVMASASVSGDLADGPTVTHNPANESTPHAAGQVAAPAASLPGSTSCANLAASASTRIFLPMLVRNAGVVPAASAVTQTQSLRSPSGVILAPRATTVSGDFATATAFLHTGDSPVQTGVVSGAIVSQRAAVLRGLACTRDGAALAGVGITIQDHPEFGSTLTQADGSFDMTVNGGALLTVSYAKDGYLQAQRQTTAPWQDYAWLPDTVLVPLDTQVTTIDLSSSTPMQVARGSAVSDADGTRQATLLIPAGTQAWLVLPGGVTQTITTLAVRATEYTAGASGPAAMPAELPAGIGYTYAIEYSVDQARTAGAIDVRFSQPLFHYVENFLNFPVGTAVPVGYYDREKATWVSSNNGRVIKILSISGGLAILDTDGDGAADTGTALGVTDAERERLAGLYPAGQTLWRVPIPHFSPWDCNWPYGPPSGASAPQQAPPTSAPPTPNPDCKEGSIIECQNQILGEAVDVTGTGFRLHYQSDRVPGRKAAYTLEIPLSGTTVPATLKRIELEMQVAGQRYTQEFSNSPNQRTSFTWDGKDGYGRMVSGQQRATARVGYVYDAVYQQPGQFDQAFGNLSGVPITNSRARQEVTLWQEWQGMIGGWDSRAQGLGGWSLSVHHAYDPTGRVLYLGDGRRRSADALSAAVITTVAGGGSPAGSSIGDGGPATQAELAVPAGVAVGPDGSLYIAEQNGQRVRRVSPTGVITTVAGTGTYGYSGDGGPATAAQLKDPHGVAIGPDGSIYIADRSNHAIRRVGADGVITTVAGTGTYGYSGDGGPAALARLNGPYGVALGPDGSLYIADKDNQRVRRVGTNGIITTVAGSGTWGFAGDGGPATQARLAGPWRVAVGPDGSLYILDRSNNRVRKVGQDGVISTVAGSGTYGFAGDGGPATSAQLASPEDVAVGPDGSLYIADRSNNRVRWVGPDGTINTVAGNGTYGFSGDGGLAIRAQLREPIGIGMAPDGSFYIADWANQRVRRVAPVMQGGSASDIYIPAEDGSEVYVFDSGGRHLRTLDALTSGVRYLFSYDSSFRLVSVTDGSGNSTAIERNTAGNPTAIVGPYGQRTTLALDANGYLSSITNPAGESVLLSTSAGGLLNSLTDRRGNAYTFQYDGLGRLTRDEAPGGGYSALSRLGTNETYTVSLSTALTRTTSYRVESLPAGGQRLVSTSPNGLNTELVSAADSTRTWSFPNGTTWTSTLDADPRWGMLAPLTKAISITNPSGLTYTMQLSSTVALTDTNSPISLSALTNTIRVNSRPYTSTYTASTRARSDITPAGRQVTATLDALGRVTARQVADLSPASYGYDSRGRLATAQQGTGLQARTTSLSYDNAGYLASITDPLGQTTGFAYDAAGRLVTRTLPDGQVVGYAYDANGNVSAITPPGRPAHSFAYTSVDQRSAYTPPDLGTGGVQTAYTYNADKQPARITRPDGQTVDFSYDSAGRLSALTTSRGSFSYAFDASTGRLATITAPAGIGLAYTHDGALDTGETWSGPVAGSLSKTYDSDYRVTATSVNGGNTIAFQYDRDGLRSQAGALTLSRNPQNGLLTGTALGSVTDTLSYNSFGEPASYSAAYNAGAIYAAQYARDKLGRITQKTETTGGSTDIYVYTYDLAGRLAEVKKNGAATASYTYDGNGNRLSSTGPGGAVNGTYDNQDRLTRYGSATYSYTAGGDLQSKNAGGQTTSYQYDALGNLTAVTLPGSTITYLVDGRNRRIGKQVNGTLTQGFLYENKLNPVAELDVSNTVISRFVYGSRSNAPDYMFRGGATYRIVADNRGSPRLVVNTATGQIAQRIDYDEFGNVISDSNPGFQPFGFAGGLYDPLTKLVRFGARDYDTDTGRWTTKDPVLFDGDQTNLYVYVSNDPVNHLDPSGLQASGGGNYTPGPGTGGTCAPGPKPGPACRQPTLEDQRLAPWQSTCSAPESKSFNDDDLEELEVQR